MDFRPVVTGLGGRKSTHNREPLVTKMKKSLSARNGKQVVNTSRRSPLHLNDGKTRACASRKWDARENGSSGPQERNRRPALNLNASLNKLVSKLKEGDEQVPFTFCSLPLECGKKFEAWLSKSKFRNNCRHDQVASRVLTADHTRSLTTSRLMRIP